MLNHRDDIFFIGVDERLRSWIFLHQGVENGNSMFTVGAVQKGDSYEKAEGVVSKFFLDEAECGGVEWWEGDARNDSAW